MAELTPCPRSSPPSLDQWRSASRIRSSPAFCPGTWSSADQSPETGNIVIVIIFLVVVAQVVVLHLSNAVPGPCPQTRNFADALGFFVIVVIIIVIVIVIIAFLLLL